MKPKQLDEVLHVFDSHTATSLYALEGDEEDYSREELLGIISEARKELRQFQDNWLIPVIEELREFRIARDE